MNNPGKFLFLLLSFSLLLFLSLDYFLGAKRNISGRWMSDDGTREIYFEKAGGGVLGYSAVAYRNGKQVDWLLDSRLKIISTGWKHIELQVINPWDFDKPEESGAVYRYEFERGRTALNESVIKPKTGAKATRFTRAGNAGTPGKMPLEELETRAEKDLPLEMWLLYRSDGNRFLLENAAETGFPPAEFELYKVAGLDNSGGKSERNVSATSWLIRAANHGHQPAQRELAMFFNILDEGKKLHPYLKPDCKSALRWLKELSFRGDFEAMITLAEYYVQGNCLDRDISKAKALLAKVVTYSGDKLEKERAAAALRHLDNGIPDESKRSK